MLSVLCFDFFGAAAFWWLCATVQWLSRIDSEGLLVIDDRDKCLGVMLLMDLEGQS